MTESTLTTGTQKQKVLFRCATHDAAPMSLCGSAPELGHWDPGAAVTMLAQPGLRGDWDWCAQIELPLGQTVEYKFVKKTNGAARWESGSNHRITIIPGLSGLSEDFRE